jgi:triphosphatase
MAPEWRTGAMKLPPRATAATALGSEVPEAPAAPSKPPMEIELKLAVPEAAREALRQRLSAYGTQPPVKLASVYFDTADRRLASQGAALRIRRVVDGASTQWIQTLKTDEQPGALTCRGEWEAVVPGPRPRLSGLDQWPVQRLLGQAPARLVAVFRTQFDRTVRTVQFQGARIEIALDEGRISAGRRSEPICEVELELREGSPSAVFALALDLVGRGREALALRPSV